MVELKNVCKQYRGISTNKDSGVYLWIKNAVHLTGNRAASVMALDNVSLSVERGEVFGIYGANGAGKTTLIKILSGLLHPSSGTVKIDGETGSRCIKNKVSYISTNGWMGLEWQLSAKENLILYGNMFGLSGRKLKQKCDEVLDAVGMTESKDKYISQLSAGMRQKITIARGLVLERPVIFYDEPSVSLDVQAAANLRALIKRDAALNGRTAIIASHNAGDISICGRILLLSKGKAIKTGTMDELKSPLSHIQLIEIKCLNPNQALSVESLPGIVSVTQNSVEDKRDILNIKISVLKQDFSLDCLIDYFIENKIIVLGIKPKEISIQEIYENCLDITGGR
jgi:ABC-2 type transport system ATP-binding protein